MSSQQRHEYHWYSVGQYQILAEDHPERLSPNDEWIKMVEPMDIEQ